MIAPSFTVASRAGGAERMEKRFFKPAIGLTRFQSGVRASEAVWKRLCIPPASRPPIIAANTTGQTALANTNKALTKWPGRASTVSGRSWRWPSMPVRLKVSWRQRSSPVKKIASMAAISTNTVCTSELRGNCPFFNASSSRRGVACSVFSPRCSLMAVPGTPGEDWRRPEAQLRAPSVVLSVRTSSGAQQLGHPHQVVRQPAQIIRDVLRHEVERQAKHRQAPERAKGEAFVKHVHLRDRAAEHGKNQRDEKRNRHDRRGHQQARPKNLAGAAD